MRLFRILAGLLFTCSLSSASPDQNKPPQFYNSARHAAADPYVLYDSNSARFFAYSTEGADKDSLFAIYSSPDLSTWHKHPGGVLKACYDQDMERIEGGQACWARDWHWAPETYYNDKTGWYFFFFAGRLREDMTKDHFQYSSFEEPSKIGVAVSRSPTGPFKEIESKPIDYYPFDPDYHDVNLIMDKKQMLPPQTLEKGQTAPKGTYIPIIDANILFDKDGRIYLYLSRNAYRNWNWDDGLGKYIEESNIIVVELERDWWDDPTATTMPEIIASQIDLHSQNASEIPYDITSYNGTGEIGHPPRKDGWKTVISYGSDQQDWENAHINDYQTYNGTRKDRRWSEGSTVITRPDENGNLVYLLTYSANNFEASNYGVGFATAESPHGPFRKASSNPILSQAPDDKVPVYSTGHGSIVASPPRHNKDGAGAQDVTHYTRQGSELFYVHHARNATTKSRSIYATRMTIDDSAIHFGSNDAVTMYLATTDQPMPRNTYPIRLHIRCSRFSKTEIELLVSVASNHGALFDLAEGSNRIVGLPGNQEATVVHEDEDAFVLTFNDREILEVAYQRLSVDGTWSTVVTEQVSCS